MESREISFVTWPDGKVDNASLTVAGEEIARQRMIAQWLPTEWFGDAPTGYQAAQLWRGMQGKGFKSWTIAIGKNGEPSIKE